MIKLLLGIFVGGFAVLAVMAALQLGSEKKRTTVRKKAWWIVKTTGCATDFTCSNCGYSFTEGDVAAVPEDAYCRGCGAEMVILEEDI